MTHNATEIMKDMLFHTYTESSGSVRIPASSYYYAIKRAKQKKSYSYILLSKSIDENYDPDKDSSPVENALASQGRVMKSAETEVISITELNAIREAIDAIGEVLNNRQLDMLLRHDMNGENFASIAKGYGVSRQTIRKTVRRAEAKLRGNEKFRNACITAGILP